MSTESTTNTEVEFIEPRNELIIKTGTGGLSQFKLDTIQATVDAMPLEIEPFLRDKINAMKNHLDNEDYEGSMEDPFMYDFLSDLVAFNVHAKLTKGQGLSYIADSLLKFCEHTSTINKDAYQVIKAYVTSLDIIMSKSITDAHKDILNSFIKELDEARNRYTSKYSGELARA